MHALPRIASSIGCLLISTSLLAKSDVQAQVELHYRWAQEALRASKLDVAASEFNAILQVAPNNAEAHANLGVIAYRRGAYAEAKESFSTALKVNPSLWDAQAFIGLCELKQGGVSDARALLEKAFPHIRNEQLRLEAGIDLIAVEQQANNQDRAADIIRELLRRYPENPDLLYFRYRIYSDLAAQSISELAKSAPDSTRLHQVLAQAAASQDDIQGAIAEYRIAVKLNPLLPGIHYELGRALLSSSQDEAIRQEARREFASELAANPEDAVSEYELGEIDLQQSKVGDAIQHYTRAIKLQPTLADAHVSLAKAIASSGDSSRAREELLIAERLEPDNDVIHYRLAKSDRKSVV